MPAGHRIKELTASERQVLKDLGWALWLSEEPDEELFISETILELLAPGVFLGDLPASAGCTTGLGNALRNIMCDALAKGLEDVPAVLRRQIFEELAARYCPRCGEFDHECSCW